MDDSHRSGLDDDLESRQDEDMIYISDDDERERDGVHNLLVSEPEVEAATRYSIIRKVAELERDALDWLEFTEDDDATAAYDLIVQLRDLLGEAPEDSDS